MDPRLSPSPQNRNPRAMADIQPVAPGRQAPLLNPFTGMSHAPAAPAKAAPAPEKPMAAPSPVQPAALPPAAPANSFKTEVVASIPVAQPGKVATAPAQMAVSSHRANNDDELDKILEAVNNRVKSPITQPVPKEKKATLLAQKVKGHGGKLKTKVGASRPVGAVVATVLVALMLAATAVFAYRQGASSQVGASVPKVGTSSSASASIQEAGNLLVKPSDLDDYSRSLQTKIDGLNDSQDFNQQPLTDQMLGL